MAIDCLHTTVLYRDTETEEFRPIITTDFRTVVSPEFFDFDNHGFYALSNRGRDCLALVSIDPAEPDNENVIFQVDGYDLDGAAYSRLRKVLAVAVYQTDKTQYHFFDETSAQRNARVERKSAGYDISDRKSTRLNSSH